MPDTASEPTVVITGTSTGIGRCTAMRLESEGWRVFAGVRRDEDGESLRRDAGDRLTPVRLEVTDSATIELAEKEVAAAVGDAGLSALVNNAGVSIGGPLEYQSTDELRDQFEINVFGVMSVTRAFLPLLKRRGGRIVNISSGAGKASSPLLGAYCASKFALEAVSDALRVELRRAGVDVCLVEPGLIRTPFIEKGRTAATGRLERLPEAGRAYYGPPTERYLEQIARLEKRGSEPEYVAAVIQRALTAARPRTRYTAGTDAKLLLALRRFLPDRALDFLFGRLTGL